MTGLYDFKTLSLELYGKHVLVIMKENSESYKQFGHIIEGLLIGRIWGKKLTTGETITVIDLTMDQGLEKEIRCDDIAFMGKSPLV